MKAKTFDYSTKITELNRWWNVRKHLVFVERTEFGNNGLTVWYTPKFNEAK